jgi:hypothetical protein
MEGRVTGPPAFQRLIRSNGYNAAMTRITPFVAALAVACIAAVAASSASPPPITQRSTGQTFRIAKGATATLRLTNRWRWSEPYTSSNAVKLTPVEYLVDPGFREWTIDAQHRGRATIRAFGRPTCTRCPLAIRRFAVTVVVRAG